MGAGKLPLYAVVLVLLFAPASTCAGVEEACMASYLWSKLEGSYDGH